MNMAERVELSRVMDKIRKLVALTNSPNEAEAALAAERAQLLLAKHNLEMSEVVKTPGSMDQVIVVDSDLQTAHEHWRRVIGAAVGELFFCRYFHYNNASTDQHSFIGQKHNVVVVKLMFEYLTKAVEQLAIAAARSYPSIARDAYVASFESAAARRLNARMSRRVHEAKTKSMMDPETKTNLPALQGLYDRTKEQLDAFVEQELGSNALAVTPTRDNKKHKQGYEDGKEAGDKISLDQQVGTSKTARLT